MMSKKLLACAAVMLLAAAAFVPSVVSAGASRAADAGFATLDVGGEQVQIYRDEYGVPHIFADTNRGLFEAYGYTLAQDRLWQLELVRRAREGRLAEILGTAYLAADKNARTLGWTDAELDAEFAALTPEEQGILAAYVDGINRYLSDVVTPDPADELPYEFHYLGLGVPPPWTLKDAITTAVGQVSGPPNTGEGELPNQSLLANLIAKFGKDQGIGVFNDLRWRNDPDTPVSLPAEGAVGKRQKPPPPPEAQLAGAVEDPPATLDEDASRELQSLGVSPKIGSHAWVVSAAKSANGSAMLFGGPQVAFNTPTDFHEVQLKGGDGFDVTGIAVAGFPAVIVGRTDHTAWTITSAQASDVTDTYIETLCGGGAGYLFDGACTPFDTRQETIDVRGAAPVQLTIRRSVHGPVITTSPGVAFTRKFAFRDHEYQELQAALMLDRARNLQDFQQAVERIPDAINVLYADRLGNIAFWQAGLVPVRAAGFDPRLPLAGDGSAEWTGDYQPLPTAINPTQGWLASWNGKPTLDWDNPDQVTFGKQQRVSEIEVWLDRPGTISLQDMQAIEEDIARTRQGGIGREAHFLKPYLLAALNAVPPVNPLAAQARAVLEAWDGSLYADARTSTFLDPGQVIFSKWLSLMQANTFGDELGANLAAANPNALIHVLDDALGGGSGVPPSRDYFNGVDPNLVISHTFDQTLSALGPDPTAWATVPRDTTQFQRTDLFPTIPSAGSILNSNRGTYAQIAVLSNPTISSEDILPLGQSGFIGGAPPEAPVFDPHFNDQLPLYREFDYKPMHLYRNTQLQE
jgi:penicillin amidase